MSNEQHKSMKYHRKLPPADTQCGYDSETTFRRPKYTRQNAICGVSLYDENTDIFSVEEDNTTVVQKGTRKANPSEAEPMSELQLLLSHLIKSQELSEARYKGCSGKM